MVVFFQQLPNVCVWGSDATTQHTSRGLPSNDHTKDESDNVKAQHKANANDRQSVADERFERVCVDCRESARRFELVVRFVHASIERRHVQQAVRPVERCFGQQYCTNGLQQHFAPRRQLGAHVNAKEA